MQELANILPGSKSMYMIVVFSYLLICVFVGFIAQKHTKGIEGYFLGGRSLGPFVAAFSYIATYVSAAAYMGQPGFAYKFGLSGVWGNMMADWGQLFGLALLAAPVYVLGKRLNALTVPELLSKRFQSIPVGTLLSIVTLIFLVPMVVAQFKAAGIVVGIVLGIPYTTAVVIFAIIIGFYVSIGGFLADAWTDTVQGLIMLLTAIVLLVVGFSSVGGVNGLVSGLAAQSPDLVSVTGPKDYWNFNMVFGFLLLLVVAQGSPQQSVRFMSPRNQRAVRYAITFSSVVVLMSSMVIVGAISRVLYPNLADPDMAVPIFIARQLPPFVGAVMFSGLLAAMMSSVDSYLLVSAPSLSPPYLNQPSIPNPANHTAFEVLPTPKMTKNRLITGRKIMLVQGYAVMSLFLTRVSIIVLTVVLRPDTESGASYLKA